MVGLVHDELFLTHGEVWHPENAERLEATMARLTEAGWLDRLERLEFGPASLEQLLWLHDEQYIESLKQASEHGGEQFTLDTMATAETWDAAVLAAGGCIAAVHAGLAGGPARSICLVRPPGHHATPDRAMGFCFLNNAALGAEAAIQGGAERVAIVDFDVHHGNGTQDMFYHRRDVLYVSLHESGLFPGTGSLDECGVEEGAGFTINIPLLPQAGDGHYRTAFSEVVVPALEEFEPELIVVSAGYDAHHSDRIAGMNCSACIFHEMTAQLVSAAQRHGQGRVVVMLEGGYDLHWLPVGAENSIRALAGEPPLDVVDAAPVPHESHLERLNEALVHVLNTHKERLGLGPLHLA